MYQANKYVNLIFVSNSDVIWTKLKLLPRVNECLIKILQLYNMEWKYICISSANNRNSANSSWLEIIANHAEVNSNSSLMWTKIKFAELEKMWSKLNRKKTSRFFIKLFTQWWRFIKLNARYYYRNRICNSVSNFWHFEN